MYQQPQQYYGPYNAMHLHDIHSDHIQAQVLYTDTANTKNLNSDNITAYNLSAGNIHATGYNSGSYSTLNVTGNMSVAGNVEVKTITVDDLIMRHTGRSFESIITGMLLLLMQKGLIQDLSELDEVLYSMDMAEKLAK